MNAINLWKLANTVVNYEIDKYLNELNYSFVGDAFVKNITLLVKNKPVPVTIKVGLTVYHNNPKHSNFICIRTKDLDSKSTIMYFDRDIDLNDFNSIGEKLIDNFLNIFF